MIADPYFFNAYTHTRTDTRTHTRTHTHTHIFKVICNSSEIFEKKLFKNSIFVKIKKMF